MARDADDPQAPRRGRPARCPAPARCARLCGRSTAQAFPATRSCKSRGNLHDYGRQAVYSSWPHSVRPLRRLAGGCAPSDPAFPARHGSGERRGAPIPRTPSRIERSPVVADDQADVIPRRPASREPGRYRRGLEDPPVGGSLADWVAAIRVMLPPPPCRARKRLSRPFWAFWGPFGGIRGRGIACNARTRSPEG